MIQLIVTGLECKCIFMSYIPKNILYICKEPVFNKKLNISLIPAFVTDPTNQKTVQTGIEWAKIWDYASNNYINQNPKQIIEQNNSTQNIKIIDMVYRSGHTTYKVIIKEFYVDFREDVMMDCLLHEGCIGGILQSQFVWARIGSQMKLIRVGSELYKSLK